MKKNIRFKINGHPQTLLTDPDRVLLPVLRTDLALTGTKYGCGEGFCGACTVLLNNQALRSCQLRVKDIAGKEVLTIEGLSRNGILHPIQKAFIKHGALQCGYCTPGMILNAYSLLLQNPNPTQDEIIQAMDDNLCRCGSYGRIIPAIKWAAQTMRGVRK